MNRLRNTFLAFLSLQGAIEFGKRIIEASDDIVTANARIALVTETTEQYLAVTEKVYSLAQQNGAAIVDTANLYSRLARSLGDVKDADLIALRTTDLISKSFLISGGNAKSASAAITQLIQGLAAGTLRGDEFNSVVEQAPRLQEALAQSLNTNVGNLRKLAEQGKLTADIVISALLKQGDALDAEAKRIPVTFSRSFVVLNNGFSLLSNSFLQAEERTGTFTGAIVYLGDVMTALSGTYKEVQDDTRETVVPFLTLKGVLTGVIAVVIFFKNTFDALVDSFVHGLAVIASSGKTVAVSIGAPLLGVLDALGQAMGGDLEEAGNRFRQSFEVIGEQANETFGEVQFAATEIAGVLDRESADMQKSLLALNDATDKAAAAAVNSKVGFQGLAGTMDDAALAAAGLSAANSKTARQLERDELRVQAIRRKGLAAVDRLNEMLRDQKDVLEPAAKATTELERASAKLVKIERILVETGQLNLENTNLLTEAYKRQIQIQKNANELNKLKIADLYASINLYEDETDSLGASTLELQHRADEVEAQYAIEELHNKIIRKKIILNEEERKSIEDLVREMVYRREETKRQIDLQSQLKSSGGTFGFIGKGEGGVDEVFQANDFGELLTTSIENGFNDADISTFFKDFSEGFGNAFKEDPNAAVSGVLGFASNAINAFKNSGQRAIKTFATLAEAIPGPVGVIAQTLNFIDNLTGGKLFGTKYQQIAAGIEVVAAAFGSLVQDVAIDEKERSLFRGTQRRVRKTDNSEATKELDSFFEELEASLIAGARGLKITVPEIIGGSFKELRDKDGKIIEQASEVLGVIYKESFEDFQKRLTAENIIALVGKSVGDVLATGIARGVGDLDPIGSGGEGGFRNPVLDIVQKLTDQASSAAGALQNTVSAQGQMVNEAQNIAQRWRDSAEALLEGAQFLLVAQTAITQGQGLLGAEATLTETTDFIERLNQAGETLTDTFTRVLNAVGLLTDTLEFLGADLELGRTAFVEFSAGVLEALGGLEQASTLYGEFLDGLFSDTEKATLALERQRIRVNKELADVGITELVDKERFKELFNQAIKEGVTEAEFAQWIEAGAAVSGFSRATETLNETLNETTDSALEAAEALRSAQEDYDEFFNAIRTDIAGSPVNETEFAAAVREARQGFDEMTAAGLRMANAAGLFAIKTEDAAAIQELTALRIGQAIDALKKRTQNLVDELFPKKRIDANSDESFLLFRDLIQRQTPVLDNRFESALELANNFRELSQVLNKDLFDTIASFGVPLDLFIKDFGVQFDQLGTSAGVFDQLVAASRALGAELPELAERLNVNIGNLFDDSSLINDAFERAIGGSSPEIAASLNPLLDALERATSPEERAAALENLEAAIKLLSPELQNIFAPFLAGIDPQSDLAQQIAALTTVNTSIQAQTPILQAIANTLGAGGGVPVPKPVPKSAQDASSSDLSSLRIAIAESSKDEVDAVMSLKDEFKALAREFKELAKELARSGTRLQRTGV